MQFQCLLVLVVVQEYYQQSTISFHHYLQQAVDYAIPVQFSIHTYKLHILFIIMNIETIKASSIHLLNEYYKTDSQAHSNTESKVSVESRKPKRGFFLGVSSRTGEFSHIYPTTPLVDLQPSSLN